MHKRLHFTLAQINPVVGDIDGNRDKILRVHQENRHSDLIIFTELVLSGYQPEDLVLYDGFMNALKKAVFAIAKQTKDGAALLISTPWTDDDGKRYNAAVLMADGIVQHIVPKYHLPNYGVFDEMRVFERGKMPSPVPFKGYHLGIMTCEDAWYDDVADHLKSQGADILISLNGSPYEINKHATRVGVISDRVHATNLPVIYTNQVGGQDEVVYDGGSFAMDADGQIILHMPHFQESVADILFPFDLPPIPAHASDNLADIYAALKLGLRDYVEKNGFKGILLGLSGGIDSAISAVIAVDALGADRVRCVMLPSPYTAQISLDDATALAKNLGCAYDIMPIEPAMRGFENIIGDIGGITAENIQSRARGVILMALSNATGDMVLSTGNKSEMAVGYATLYGDMCGGFNVLKDIYKTQVYALSRWRNDQSPVIPERIITRAPSAELRPDQTDQDSLPPYDILDAILTGFIEKKQSITQLTAEGFDRETVQRVRQLLDRAEYKRRQSAPGVKVTSTAFGRERRMPITNRYENA